MRAALSIRQPKARQIARDLQQLVRRGQYHAGDTLPSLRELSRTYGVSHETVRRALLQLEGDGLVRSVHGAGTVVNGADAPSPAPGAGAGSPLGPPEAARTSLLDLRTCEFDTEKRTTWVALVQAFQAAHPGLLVQPHGLAGNAWLGVTEGDLLHLPAWDIAELGARGRLLDLRPFGGVRGLYGDDLIGDFTEPAPAGPCWGVPIAFDLGLAYLNTAVLTAPELRRLGGDWTIEGITRWAAARAARPRTPAPVRWPRPHLLLAFCGLDIWDLRALRAHLARLPEVLARLAAAHAQHPLLPAPPPAGDSAAAAHEDFVAGRCPLVFHHSYAMADTLRRVAFAWAVWPQPLPPGQAQRRISLAVAVTRQCLNPEAAVAFIRFLASAAGQALLAAGRTNVPVRRSAALGPFAAPPPVGLGRVVQELALTRERSEIGGRAFGVAYAAVWDQEIAACLTAQQDRRATAARIADRCTALVTAYGLTTA